MATNKWIGAPVMNQFWKDSVRLGDSQGYLHSYLGNDTGALVCPGSSFKQGLEAFCKGAVWVEPYTPATYQSFPSFNDSLRKIQHNHVYSKGIDRLNGWENVSLLPVFTDSILYISGWAIPNGRWDQNGSVVHSNTGTVPILMSDGHVTLFERSAYPPFWGDHPTNPDPFVGFKTQIDDLLVHP